MKVSNRSLRYLHLGLLTFWSVNLVVVIWVYFKHKEMWTEASILYLAVVSIYANMVGHWSGWQAAHVEKAIKAEDHKPSRDQDGA